MFQETGAVTRFPSATFPERPQQAERDERNRSDGHERKPPTSAVVVISDRR